jgi:hypothetical protein
MCRHIPGAAKYLSKINFKNDVPNEKKNNKKGNSMFYYVIIYKLKKKLYFYYIIICLTYNPYEPSSVRCVKLNVI